MRHRLSSRLRSISFWEAGRDIKSLHTSNMDLLFITQERSSSSNAYKSAYYALVLAL